MHCLGLTPTGEGNTACGALHVQSQPQCSKHWHQKSVCLHLNPSYLEKNRNTDVWVKEEGLEKGQRGSGTGGSKSRASESQDLTQDVWVSLDRGRKGS